MSATNSCEVSQIQDEDVLRRMWQETEDFGRKKEIRAHMYKIREARLRDFYNSGEMNKEIQRTNSSSGIERKGTNTHHTDLLADHSFLSLKSKEIRDSESPTRDVHYGKISSIGGGDKGWTVKETNEKSADGKTHTTSKLATTSGMDQIDGGVSQYAAKNEQLASVYRDGDDKNFTKSVGASTKSQIVQEAHGGDDNNKFYTSSKTSKSSSKVVTEHKSTSGDDFDAAILKDPNTRVYTETKTLPDGSTVTTTRYETIGRTSQNFNTSSSNSSYSTQQMNEHRTSSSHDEGDNVRVIRYTQQPSERIIEHEDFRYQNPSDTRSTMKIIRTSEDYQRPSVNEHTTTSSSTTQHQDKNEHVQRFNTSTVHQTKHHHDEHYESKNREDSTFQNTLRENKFQTNVEHIVRPTQNETIYKEHIVYKNEPKQIPVNRPQPEEVEHVYKTEPRIVPIQKSQPQDEPLYKSQPREEPIYQSQPREEPLNKSQPRDEPIYKSQPREEPLYKSQPKEEPIQKKDQETRREEVINIKVVRQDKNFNDDFINVEKQHLKDTTETPRYIQPDRREPIRPATSDFKVGTTEGQYDTTYRSEFTNKKISVEVSPTHDAFARSLRSVTPDRDRKSGSPMRGSTRSLRTSTSSLRSSASPEKNRHPGRYSPDRRTKSPTKKNQEKFASNETITKYSTDTLTRRKDTQKKTMQRSRSNSPTETVSTDFEYRPVRNEQVTDLDDDSDSANRKTKRISERSPTSPIKQSPGKDTPRRSSLKTTPTNSEDTKKMLRRTDTYEERCRQILGIAEKKKIEKNISDILLSDKARSKSPEKKSSPRRSSDTKVVSPNRKPSETRKSPESPIKKQPKTNETPLQTRKNSNPEKSSPKKDSPKINEFPSQIRRNKEKEPLEPYPEYNKPTKQAPKINEFPSQIRKTPERQPLEPYPEKSKPNEYAPTICEFPSQIRRSPEREPLEPYPQKKSPQKDSPSINEFPSQIRKTPEREPLEPYPEKIQPRKDAPTICEFPSQIRRSTEKEPLEPYPEKKLPKKNVPSINEFPSQIPKTPEREPLEPLPQKKSPRKDAPSVCEFPSQIRRTPEREPLEPYPEKTLPRENAPSINEFPSQIRKTPEREPLEQYPEKKTPRKDAPTVCEFPSQIRRTQEKESMEPYPESKSPKKNAPTINEFPSQIRKGPEREPLEPYPQKKSPRKDAPTVCEFPSQIRRSPEREPLEPYPEKKSPKKNAPSINEFPSQIRKTSEREPLEPFPEKKSPKKEAPTICEFPSQIRKSPEREPLEPYPEKETPQKSSTSVNEFPSQIRKTPERQPLDQYPEKKTPRKDAPSVCEFPSQIRKTPETEIFEPYPEQSRPTKDTSKINEFPSQIRRSPERAPLDSYPEKTSPKKYTTKIDEFPSQIRRSPEREPLEPYPEKTSPKKYSTKIDEFPSQIRKSPEREPLEPFSEKKSPRKIVSKTREIPSQIPRRSPEREPLDQYPEKKSPMKESPSICEFPSQIRKTSQKQPLEPYPEKKTPRKETPIGEHPSYPKTPAKEVLSQGRKVPEKKPLRPVPKQMPKTKVYPELTSTSKVQLRKNKIQTIEDQIIKTQRSRLELTKQKHKKQDVEDDLLEKTTKYIEGKRVPVDEPLFVKKFISKLGSDDEDDDNEETLEVPRRRSPERPSPVKRTEDVYVVNEKVDFEVKKSPERLSPVRQKTVKKDLSRKTQEQFIGREKIDTEITLTKSTTSNKKKEDVVKKRVEIKKIIKAPTPTRLKPTTERVTITKQVPERVTITKQLPKKKVEPQKIEKKPTHRTVVTKDVGVKQFGRKEFLIDIKPKKPAEKVTKRTVVSTVINLSPKSKTPKKSSPAPSKPKQRKPIENGHRPQSEEEDSENEEDIKIKEKKCVSTKSIIINNTVADQREIIVDLQRSKSSREETPDNVWPVTAEEEFGIPRYPDQILEPEEPYRKPKRTVDVPLTESEDVTEFNRITEITDESLLTVNEKVNKFTEKKTTKKMGGPAPKVERPTLIVDEDLAEDECLLSVTDKVNKFITTAEKLTERPKSPRCQNFNDLEETKHVSEKVTHFTTDQIKPKLQPIVPKVQRPDLSEVDETLRTDDCLLSVSDKVSKFITTAEKLTKPAAREKSPKPVSLDDITTTECVTIVDDEDYETKIKTKVVRKPVNEDDNRHSPARKVEENVRRVSPIRKVEDPQRVSPLKERSPVRKIDETRRPSLKKTLEETPKSSRRPSQEDKIILSTVGRLRSTESIKKARALFENVETKDKPKQRDIIGRPSVFEARKSIKKDEVKLTDIGIEKEELDEVRQKLSFDEEEDDIPGYMKQLDRTLRAKSPHRPGVREMEEIAKGHIQQQHHEETKTTKFGVVLKKTETENTERRRSSITTTITTVESNEKELEIEEIYDLEILEAMLIKVVSYDIRKRIRTQIKIVKNLIAENKLHTKNIHVVIKERSKSPEKVIRAKSPEKVTRQKSPDKVIREKSPEKFTREKSPEKVTREKSPEKVTREKSPEKVTREKSPEKVIRAKSPEKIVKDKSPSRKSPERKPKTFTPELKKTTIAPKTVVDDKPEWVTQRNLKKVNERQVTNKKSTATTSTTVVKKRTSVSPVKSTDVITSSYGVGPTDENGVPLFGLKALKTQSKNEKTKVQGTVMHSTYYSENGNEPVGEVSVTKYSTDPTDLGSTEDLKNAGDGLISKTTTQKFGYKDTPSYRSLTDKKSKTKTDESRTVKVTRRGSVKEMSQKFLDNAVQTLKGERQSTYPKAGLILRTSSFKDTSSLSSREASPIDISEDEVTTVKSSSTFLTNTSKVTNVQDVIGRMKAEDCRDGESAEDAEARNLLNKFIGSQVILAGMEGTSSSRKTTSSSASTTTSASKKITKVTTTVTENDTPHTTTRSFTHPIGQEVLDTIWEEQTLRLLLEQSTEYEERRLIRLRLKQVMAEKEACAEVVEKTLEETRGNVEGESLLLPLLQGVLDAPEQSAADSGTESGEDLRSGLITEVQNALDKLTACLCSDSSDITTERRDSLLQLVTKLQANLTPTDQGSGSSERRLNRFARRRQRQNRHTVGVTSEELEDARRLMEELALRERTLSNPLQKQNSESSVKTKPTEFRPVKFQPHKAIKNATAKPFNYNSSQSETSSTLDTPNAENPDLLFTDNFDNPKFSHSISLDQDFLVKKRPLSQTFSLDYSREPASLQPVEIVEPITVIEPNPLREGETLVLYDQSIYNNTPKPDLIPAFNPEEPLLQNNPIYSETDNEKASKFNNTSKRLRMKRANTIDIPKPLNFYQFDDESDTDQEVNTRRSNYLALRGPIRIGKQNSNQTVPTFEPKTDSDKKFMAFLNKHNEPAPAIQNKISLWDKQADNNNWQRKFGNIKTNFEQKGGNSSARSFWKSADDAVAAGSISYNGPKISRQNAKNLQQMFENKQKEVVTGSLQVKAVNHFSHNPQSAFKPIQKTNVKVNQQDMYLYSPKPFEQPQNQTPWSARVGERRVLSMAANKFEQPQPVEEVKFKPRKMSKEKIAMPPVLQHNEPQLPKVQIPKSGGSVRKLSGQYDNLGNRDYVAQTNVKYVHQSAFAPVPQKQSYHKETYLPQNETFKKDSFIPHQEIFKPQQDTYKPKNEVFKLTQKDNVVIHAPKIEREPYVAPSFHTTSPQVQNLQQKTKVDTYQPYSSKEQANLHPEPHVFYNNIHKEPTIARPKYESQVSQESLHEYNAISSKVMTAPMSQQAVTVQQNQPKTRNDHDMEAAFNLKNVLVKKTEERKSPIKPKSPSFHGTTPHFRVNDKPLNLESLEINDMGESIVTSKFQIPMAKSGQALSKSDSWHQICQEKQQIAKKPSPRASPNARTVLKSKSSHTLALPKQFEASMTREEQATKNKIMEAFFSGGSKSPQPKHQQKKTSVNRTKTSQKSSMSTGLCRSRTLPDIVCADLLDETNVDAAFEDLFKKSA